MAKTLEELAKEIYNEALEDGEPVSEEEALAMAKMELGSKEITNYTQATVKKERKKAVRKVDENKKAILGEIKILLEGKQLNCGYDVPDVQMENETDLHFTMFGENYSLKLTKHRPPKK